MRLPTSPALALFLAWAFSFFLKFLLPSMNASLRAEFPPHQMHCFDLRPFLELFTILSTTHLNVLSWPFVAAPLAVFDGECFEACGRHF